LRAGPENSGKPRRFAFFTEVNNNHIGAIYVATGFLFFLGAGVLALLMRVQLAYPGMNFLDAATYNQFFTMHGTVMMFLFAVPIVEASAVLLLPGMIGARDMPFPRLSALGYWCYALGGALVFASLFFNIAPDGGWFMYPPLTGPRFSPGVNTDVWILGLGFVEIAAVAAAVELIVGILKTRAPGMALARMPIFAWYMLVTAAMIMVGMPAVIAADILLELERGFGMPFYDATRGGDPLLWQHLFWLFGHPEVYIVFLPAAGICGAPGSEVFIAEQFGLPVPSAAAFNTQTVVTIGNGAIGQASFPISANLNGPAGTKLLDTTNNIVYVDNTATVAALLGPCSTTGPGGISFGSGLSRGGAGAGNPAGNPFCEPNLLVPAGTLVQTGPVGAGGLAA